jgi:hypothetical protein
MIVLLKYFVIYCLLHYDATGQDRIDVYNQITYESQWQITTESKAGACGLLQIMPICAKQHTGYDIPCWALKYVVPLNIWIGLQEIKMCRKCCSENWQLCYTAGRGAYREWLEERRNNGKS